MGRLIDADELFEQVGNIKPNNKQQYEDIGMFMEMITNSLTIEPKQSEWGYVFEHLGFKYHKCMACYTCIKVDSDHQKYCPECGAYMKEGAEK